MKEKYNIKIWKLNIHLPYNTAILAMRKKKKKKKHVQVLNFTWMSLKSLL